MSFHSVFHFSFLGQQFLTETAQFFHTRADSLELLEKIETSQTIGGKEDVNELSEYVKEEDEEGGEEEGGEEEKEGQEGAAKKLTRLIRNRDINSVEETEEMDVEHVITPSASTSVTSQVCTLSARRLRLQLAEMSEEERREWRALALRPGTVPYAGTYDTHIGQNNVYCC